MTFRFADVDGRAALVDADDQWYDLDRLTSAAPDRALADAELRAPAPAVRDSFGVGLNHRSHAAESNMELPEKPLVFSKSPSCIVGLTPDVEVRTKTGHWEVERPAVIGERGRDLPADEAWDHVLGLTVGRDISDRALQFGAKPPDFDLGKSRDTYGPAGPVSVSTMIVSTIEGIGTMTDRCV